MFDVKDTDFFDLEEESFKNIIQDDIVFTGNIKTGTSFMIHGMVNGTIASESDLVIDANAVVNADIRADRVLVRGKVRGNVIGKKLIFVTSSGSLEGNISTEKVVLEPGCIFRGQCTMNTAEQDL